MLHDLVAEGAVLANDPEQRLEHGSYRNTRSRIARSYRSCATGTKSRSSAWAAESTAKPGVGGAGKHGRGHRHVRKFLVMIPFYTVRVNS